MTKKDSQININGMAHVILTVSQFDKARKFYSSLLPEMGMSLVHDGTDFCYHVGARTAIGVRKCDKFISKYARIQFLLLQMRYSRFQRPLVEPA